MNRIDYACSVQRNVKRGVDAITVVIWFIACVAIGLMFGGAV